MANWLETARDFVTGNYIYKDLAPTEQKFSPADPTVNWTYVEHLVHTANTRPYGQNEFNSAVFACMRALAFAAVEAPLRVVRDDEPQPNSPIQLLLDEPHPELDIMELRWWCSWARNIDGNAYLLKVRGDGGRGLPVELWPLNPIKVEPVTERGSSRLIDAYAYDRGDGRGRQMLAVEDIIHFKLGVDPADPRRGISPLKVLLSEIATDEEATHFAHALLQNFGIPGLVITVPADSDPGPDRIREMKASTKAEFGSDSRGKVGVLTGGATMAQFGFNPEQMNLKALHDFPETRIAAVLGVDQLVARLGVGLEQMSNYASARQVRENFTELTVVPQWKLDESKWTRRLAREFTDDRMIRIEHDLSVVRALQEDENEKHARILSIFTGGVITREEARQALGYDPEMQPQEIVSVPSTVQFVTVDQAVTDIEEERQREADAQAAQLEAVRSSQPEQPAQPSGSKARTAEQDSELFSRLVQGIVDQASDEMAADLSKLQAAQQKRVERALVNGKA